LARAFAACRAGRADTILVARLDRLTYSLVDLAHLVEEAREGGINLVAPDLGVDLSTPEGAHLAEVLAAAAGWSERPLARARSVFAGHLPHEPRRRGRPSSTPHDLAERIRGLRAAGNTLQAICDLLNAEGVPTPRGGTQWRPSSLRAILRPLRAGAGEEHEGRTT
jgi:DNA invertase Pin-like site-specific DNA recombinase